MKRMMKLISILVILITVVVSINTIALATVTGVSDPKTLSGQAVSGTSGITTLGNQIITIVTTIGSVASVIVLVVLGLKYMMGSAEEKADYKKSLLPYVIGAVLVFAASTIAGVIFGFANNIKM